ncbi:MAG TPA: inner membrane CreD family protein [Candidatus Baltobacteraceae bacterium]
MLPRLSAIVVIFCGASLAWMILGGTLLSRTDDSNASQTTKLTAQWGSAQTQSPPQITARIAKHDVVVPLVGSRIAVNLDLQQRRKGLLWYNLYNVRFASHYRVRNTTDSSELAVHFPFPSDDGTYTDFAVAIGGHPIPNATALSQGKLKFTLAPGQETTIDISYLSRGMDAWVYSFGNGVQPVNNFDLTMTTNFSAIDFPPQTLLPVSERRVGNAWTLRWNYGTLVTADGIGMAMPSPMQPGPLAQRITFWAPVALLFYFFVMLVITTLRKIDLHPVNYFFLAAAFFAFHLLFGYLVDRVDLWIAFVICSLVSMFLTISYLRLVVGLRFAAVESALAQLVYLILFSYALFNEGWSGLAITIGVIITLFVVMQVTGRIRWNERFVADPGVLDPA